MLAQPGGRIRRIGSGDALLLRDLRIRSVADSPDAFGQTVEVVQRRPSVEWERQARRSSRGDRRTWLIAEHADSAVGLVQGRKRRPGTLLLFSMWVAPETRQRGYGRALIDAAEAWARGWDATQTILWVYTRNEQARTFYARLGFEVLRDGEEAEAGARYGALAMRRSTLPPSP
jgi:GNAT superfamily N-acetyltransferase